MTRHASTTDKLVTMAFRHRESRRMMLEVVRKKSGHADLSVTLRAAVDEYIDRHLLRQKKLAS